MGFFSKVWKGIKGTFKKIGKGIKKTFNKFGKFMGKIGILGQVAMMFILPGIGSALLKSVMKLAHWGSEAGGLIGGIAKGAAWTLGKAAEFAKYAKGRFGDLTQPITGFFKTAGKYVGSKLQKVLGPNFKLPAKWNIPENYTLEQARTEWWQENVVKNWKAFKDESSNFFSTSIESVLPKTGPIDLGTDEFGEVQTLVPEISPDMSARDKRLFGEAPFVEGYNIEYQLPARGGLPAPPPSIGYPDESRISEILQNTKDGVYTPPDPTVTPVTDPEITWADRMRQAPEKAWDAGMARIGGDTASSLLSGEARGVWAKPAEPLSTRTGGYGSFKGDPPMLAPDQDLTAFMSFEDTYKPADPLGIWGGQSNYRAYLNRFAPTQLTYA